MKRIVLSFSVVFLPTNQRFSMFISGELIGEGLFRHSLRGGKDNDDQKKVKDPANSSYIGNITTLIFICQWQWTLLQDEREQERIQALKQTNDPELLAEAFLQYLMESKIEYAKELVIPEQQGRIDRWLTISNHQAYECPYEWKWALQEPLQNLANGSTSSLELTANTISVDTSYHCVNIDHSMYIHAVITHDEGIEWIIKDWKEICEKIGTNPETCYP